MRLLITQKQISCMGMKFISTSLRTTSCVVMKFHTFYLKSYSFMGMKFICTIWKTTTFLDKYSFQLWKTVFFRINTKINYLTDEKFSYTFHCLVGLLFICFLQSFFVAEVVKHYFSCNLYTLLDYFLNFHYSNFIFWLQPMKIIVHTILLSLYESNSSKFKQ